MIHMKNLDELPIEILVGGVLADLQCKPLTPFAPQTIAFLTDWSKHLLAHPKIRAYPDAAGFAYWCRPANLARIQRQINLQEPRLGRGLALHIAPANVPVNFAFSFVFGLLAGNANIVRVPESLPVQARLMCEVASQLLAQPEHARVAEMTRMLRYPRNDNITQAFSAVADVRLLWGGDMTIQHLRGLTTPPRCIDICFSDRYSVCLLSAGAVLSVDGVKLKALALGFYNDVFLLDQNACSSPHLVLWQGSTDEVAQAQHRFWTAVRAVLQSKPLSPAVHAVDRYAHFCRTAIRLGEAIARSADHDLFDRVMLRDLPQNIADLRGRHGFFFESIDNDLSQLRKIVGRQYQTLTCFGVDAENLIAYIVKAGLSGIDRVVPVGKALDIGVIWDGYDMTRSMSRIISMQ